jgi:hypothetical protein
MVAAFDPRYKPSPGEIVDRSRFVGACQYTFLTFHFVPCLYLQLTLLSIQALAFSLLSRVNMGESAVANSLND